MKQGSCPWKIGDKKKESNMTEIQTVFNEEVDVEQEMKEAGIEIIVPEEEITEEKGEVDKNE